MYSRHAQELADRLAIGRAHQLHRVRRQAGVAGRLLEQLDDRPAGVHRLLAAAEDHRVAAFTQIAAASAVTFGRDS